MPLGEKLRAPRRFLVIVTSRVRAKSRRKLVSLSGTLWHRLLNQASAAIAREREIKEGRNQWKRGNGSLIFFHGFQTFPRFPRFPGVAGQNGLIALRTECAHTHGGPTASESWRGILPLSRRESRHGLQLNQAGRCQANRQQPALFISAYRGIIVRRPEGLSRFDIIADRGPTDHESIASDPC